MMKLCRNVLGAVTLLVTASTVAFAQVPTFNKDVAPILYEKCVACHRTGEVAPMSLISYKEVRPWARAIKARTVARQMPPWFADTNTSHKLRGVMVLTDAEIETLTKWADGGAPEGTTPAPTPPTLAESGSSKMPRPPDYVISSPDVVEIPATGTIPVVVLWSKTNFTEDTFFEAAELRPMNRAVTHHAGVYGVPLPAGTKTVRGPAWKGGPVVEGVIADASGNTSPEAGLGDLEAAGRVVIDPFTGPRTARAANFENSVATYAPAGGFFRYTDGTAKRLGPDNNYLNWNLHYTGTGRPEKAQEQLLLWKLQGPVKHEVLAALIDDVELVNGKELTSKRNRPNIKPYEENYTIVSMTAFDSPVTILNFWPHMHLRGKSMKFVATFPDGREEVLLNVPRYQFDWQLFYELEKPVKLPAGTVLRAEAVYDNSAKNRLNPSPGTEVIWGGMSWNEMHFPFVEFTLDKDVEPWKKARNTGQPSTK